MPNKLIVNEMPSVLDLSVIKDVNGNAVTLRPRGTPGASREVVLEATRHEVVQRVIDLKWVSIRAVSAPAAAEPEPPPPVFVDLDDPPAVTEIEIKLGARAALDETVPAAMDPAATPPATDPEPSVPETDASVPETDAPTEEPPAVDAPAEEPPAPETPAEEPPAEPITSSESKTTAKIRRR